MMEGDLVIKKGSGYRLSNVDIIQKNTHEWMGRTLRCLKTRRGFVQELRRRNFFPRG